jgi:hypothetical protein
MKIDLGTVYDSPSMAMPEMPSKPEQNKHYPTLNIECGDVMLNGLPDEGVIELRYKVTSRSCNERNGKKTCCITLEAREILDIEPRAKGASDSADSPAEALDKLAELESANEDAGEYGEE